MNMRYHSSASNSNYSMRARKSFCVFDSNIFLLRNIYRERDFIFKRGRIQCIYLQYIVIQRCYVVLLALDIRYIPSISYVPFTKRQSSAPIRLRLLVQRQSDIHREYSIQSAESLTSCWHFGHVPLSTNCQDFSEINKNHFFVNMFL